MESARSSHGSSDLKGRFQRKLKVYKQPRKWVLPGHWTTFSDSALAGISGGQSPDSVGWIRDLVSSVLNESGVSVSHVWHIKHQVGPIMAVTDICFLGFPSGSFRRKQKLLPKYQCFEYIIVCSTFMHSQWSALPAVPHLHLWHQWWPSLAERWALQWC